MVKTSDPPCIGFINGVVYDEIRAVELYQRHHGIPAPELRTRETAICPEDWLTIKVENADSVPRLTLEAMMSNTRPEILELEKVMGPQHRHSISAYTIRGVWCDHPKDDTSVGAELCWNLDDGYDAILF